MHQFRNWADDFLTRVKEKRVGESFSDPERCHVDPFRSCFKFHSGFVVSNRQACVPARFFQSAKKIFGKVECVPRSGHSKVFYEDIGIFCLASGDFQDLYLKKFKMENPPSPSAILD